MQNRDPAGAPLRLMERLKPFAVTEPAAWLKPTWQAASSILLPQARPAPTLGRIGALEVRLAGTRKEIRRAQKLRYKVFYRDGTAIADAATMLARRDKDAFDKICDHLLVIDHAAMHPVKAHAAAQAAGRRHLPAAAAGSGRAARRLLHRERVRHRQPGRAAPRLALPRARPLLRAAALPQQAHGRTAVARRVELCAAEQVRRDDRLRQPRRHRSGSAGAAAVVPASLCPRAGRLARERAAAPARRHEPDGEGRDRSEEPRCANCRR